LYAGVPDRRNSVADGAGFEDLLSSKKADEEVLSASPSFELKARSASEVTKDVSDEEPVLKVVPQSLAGSTEGPVHGVGTVCGAEVEKDEPGVVHTEASACLSLQEPVGAPAAELPVRPATCICR